MPGKEGTQTGADMSMLSKDGLGDNLVFKELSWLQQLNNPRYNHGAALNNGLRGLRAEVWAGVKDCANQFDSFDSFLKFARVAGSVIDIVETGFMGGLYIISQVGTYEQYQDISEQYRKAATELVQPHLTKIKVWTSILRQQKAGDKEIQELIQDLKVMPTVSDDKSVVGQLICEVREAITTALANNAKLQNVVDEERDALVAWHLLAGEKERDFPYSLSSVLPASKNVREVAGRSGVDVGHILVQNIFKNSLLMKRLPKQVIGLLRDMKHLPMSTDDVMGLNQFTRHTVSQVLNRMQKMVNVGATYGANVQFELVAEQMKTILDGVVASWQALPALLKNGDIQLDSPWIKFFYDTYQTCYSIVSESVKAIDDRYLHLSKFTTGDLASARKIFEKPICADLATKLYALKERWEAIANEPLSKNTSTVKIEPTKTLLTQQTVGETFKYMSNSFNDLKIKSFTPEMLQ